MYRIIFHTCARILTENYAECDTDRWFVCCIVFKCRRVGRAMCGFCTFLKLVYQLLTAVLLLVIALLNTAHQCRHWKCSVLSRHILGELPPNVSRSPQISTSQYMVIYSRMQQEAFCAGLKTTRIVFWPVCRPELRWGSSRRSPRPLSRLWKGISPMSPSECWTVYLPVPPVQ